MGDGGALALGAALGTVAVIVRQELVLFIMGGVFVAETLSQVGCSYIVDIASAHGFEYYTGVIFQFYLAGQKIGGGGRYDDLIAGVGGPPTPASGFALYLDDLMALAQDMCPDTPPRVEVRADTSANRSTEQRFEVTRLLRDAGYQAELDLGVASTPLARWSLLVRGEGRPLALMDRQSGRSVELANPTELLKLLEQAAPC